MAFDSTGYVNPAKRAAGARSEVRKRQHQVKVRLDDHELMRLTGLAAKHGKSLAEVLRSAIWLWWWDDLVRDQAAAQDALDQEATA